MTSLTSVSEETQDIISSFGFENNGLKSDGLSHHHHHHHSFITEEFNAPITNVNEDSFKEISQNAKKKGKNYEKYLVDESLNETDRALYLLKCGSGLQKFCVMEQLPSIFRRSNEKSITAVLKYIIDNTWRENEQVQIMIGELLPDAFPFVPQRFMPTLFQFIQSMTALRDEELASTWQDTLIKIIEHMHVDSLEKEVLPLAQSKGNLYESEKNRVFCCRLFGALSTRFNSQLIEKEILPMAVTLCQDTSFNVRCCMAEQIYFIAHGLGFEVAKVELIHELFQLSDDETKVVKNTAITTLISLIDFFEHKYRLREVVPRFLFWMSQPPEESKPVLITKFGEYFHKLSRDKHDDETISVFLRFFRDHASSTTLQYRLVCAYNIPAVLKTIGPKKYMSQLHAVYSALSHDSNVQVREKIAVSIHEMARILSRDKAIEHIKTIFLSMMKDAQVSVRNKVLWNMIDVFRSFKGPSSDSVTQRTDNDFFTQVTPLLCKHAYTIGRDWRSQESFYSSFKSFEEFFTPDEIQTSFIPLLKTQIVKGVKPVKTKAVESFVCCARSLKNYGAQTELFKTISVLLARDKSYWNRITYFDFCFSVIKHFSRQFFKDFFFAEVMNLAKDPVPNVRRRFCFLLPHIKLVLELPNDVQMLADLKERISFLTLDKDRDVAEAARYAHDELTTIDNEIMRGYKLNLLSRADLFDKQKQREEEEWISSGGDKAGTTMAATGDNNSKLIPRRKSDTALAKASSPPSTTSTMSNGRLGVRPNVRSKSQTRVQSVGSGLESKAASIGATATTSSSFSSASSSTSSSTLSTASSSSSTASSSAQRRSRTAAATSGTKVTKK